MHHNISVSFENSPHCPVNELNHFIGFIMEKSAQYNIIKITIINMHRNKIKNKLYRTRKAQNK